jgi:hypothetical protein
MLNWFSDGDGGQKRIALVLEQVQGSRLKRFAQSAF